jgi:hypothetical protein
MHHELPHSLDEWRNRLTVSGRFFCLIWIAHLMCSLMTSVKKGWATMIEWREFSVRAPDIVTDDAGMTVQFSNGRVRRIDVRTGDGVIELRGVVARRSVAEQIHDVLLMAWERNRASSLVAFRVDDRGHLIGECWVPTDGLTRDKPPDETNQVLAVATAEAPAKRRSARRPRPACHK